MATQFSDQLKAVNVNAQGFSRKISTSEKYGKVRSFNVTLNSTGSYASGETPATVTFNNGDIVQLAEIKANDKVRSIRLLDATGDAGVSFNVGLAYGTVSTNNAISGAANPGPGTLANATAYAAADSDIQAAHLAPVELAWLNRTPGNANDFVWEDAGLNENPGGTFFIVLQITAGTLTLAPDQVAFLIDVIND